MLCGPWPPENRVFLHWVSGPQAEFFNGLFEVILVEKLERPRVSVIVTALNKELLIEPTIHQIYAAVEGLVSEYEIVCVNDGSTDQTGKIMDRLAKEDKHIKVIHNAQNLNLGGAFKRGLKEVTLDYVMWLPGDNAAPAETIRITLEKIGQADIVVPYLLDTTGRSLPRRVISRSYTTLLNFLFRLNLRYYNGIVVHRRELLQGIEITTSSFACFAEALIKLLRGGATYVEVGFNGVQRSVARTSAFRIKNVVNVVKTIFYLYWVCVLKKSAPKNAHPAILPVEVNAE